VSASSWLSSAVAHPSAQALERHNRHALLAAERCVLGVTACPARPLLLIDYKYWWQASWDVSGPGETVWGWTAVSHLDRWADAD
jgi:hypothetical protein